MKEYVDKSEVVAEIERLQNDEFLCDSYDIATGFQSALRMVQEFIDTLEVKEVDIASMADEYYNALIKEAEMDVDMAGHCRLAYYNGCKDVIKAQKGE